MFKFCLFCGGSRGAESLPLGCCHGKGIPLPHSPGHIMAEGGGSNPAPRAGLLPQGHRPPCSSPQPTEGKAAGSREGTWGKARQRGLGEKLPVSSLGYDLSPPKGPHSDSGHRLPTGCGASGGTGRAGEAQGPLPPPRGKGSVKSFGAVGFASGGYPGASHFGLPTVLYVPRGSPRSE